MENNSLLFIAKLLIHEGIHANLYAKIANYSSANLQNVFLNNNEFDYEEAFIQYYYASFVVNDNNWQHNFMANEFLPELSELPNLLIEQKNKINQFNMEYRPKSFWYPESLETKILSQIKGQERKKAILSFIKDNKRIPDTFLTDENLPPDIIVIEASMNMISKVAAYNKKREFKGSKIIAKEIICENYNKFKLYCIHAQFFENVDVYVL